MSVPTNLITTYTGTPPTSAASAHREDLENAIYRVTPEDTPAQSRMRRGNATATAHEWQTDVLRQAANNAALSGADATLAARGMTTRLQNFCQITEEAFGVSGSEDAVGKAGMRTRTNYETVKCGVELRQDIEYNIVRNFPSVAGDSSTARQSASMESWIETNTKFASVGGSDGGYQAGGTVSAPTDGTPENLTEAQFEAVLESIWRNAGMNRGEIIFTSGVHKKEMADNWQGVSPNRTNIARNSQGVIVAAVDLYVSSYGTHEIQPHRYVRDASADTNGTVLILTMMHWALHFLRPFRRWPLAKTGDSSKHQLLAEWTLVSRNEKSSGACRDLSAVVA